MTSTCYLSIPNVSAEHNITLGQAGKLIESSMTLRLKEHILTRNHMDMEIFWKMKRFQDEKVMAICIKVK